MPQHIGEERKSVIDMKMMCKKCNIRIDKIVIKNYEYERGIPLNDVEAYGCKKCGEFVFTEEQIENIEKRTEVAKIHRFSFERKLTVSGRSLVINIPEDVVRHMNLSKGKVATLTPIDDKSFIVEVKKSSGSD